MNMCIFPVVVSSLFFCTSFQMEELADKVENLEIAVDASNEIIVEKCGEMESRLNELENNHKTEIANLRAEFQKEIEEMSLAINSVSFQASPIYSSSQIKGSGRGGRATETSPLDSASGLKHGSKRASTVAESGVIVGSGYRSSFQMPVTLDDVDQELREKIRPYVRNSLDHKEKLSPLQLGFCDWWLTISDAQSARRGTATALREAGIHNKIWSSSWSPDIVGEFEGYLVEKIKLWMKKQKKDLLQKGIKRKSDGADY